MFQSYFRNQTPVTFQDDRRLGRQTYGGVRRLGGLNCYKFGQVPFVIFSYAMRACRLAGKSQNREAWPAPTDSKETIGQGSATTNVSSSVCPLGPHVDGRLLISNTQSWNRTYAHVLIRIHIPPPHATLRCNLYLCSRHTSRPTFLTCFGFAYRSAPRSSRRSIA